MSNKLDDPKTTVNRIEIINNKPILKLVYKDFYNIFKKSLKNIPKGKIVELGSGAGFIKDIIPNVNTTDIMNLPNVDMAKIDAEKLPFKDNSVAAIVMLNTLHHINNPQKALKEFQRVLKTNGKVIMIEPWNSFWGRFVNQNFHHEEFDPSSNWKLSKKGPLSGGNGAIPWIIFERDKQKYNKTFQNLSISKIEIHSPIKYLVSGGFSRPQLIPTFFYKLILSLENLISPMNKKLGMFATIVLKKN